MKSQLHSSLIVLALLALSTLNSEISTALAQGTAFTYSGQLQTGGGPANGTYNLTFTLFDTNTSGVPITQVVTNNGVSVSNGLFTVQIDFGTGVFTGATTWLEIGVEPSGSPTFTTLTPRQQVTPTPNAIYATTAGSFTGTVSVSQLPPTVVISGESNVTLISATVNGTISGNGNGILSLNGAQVDSVGNGNPLPSSPGSPPTFSAGNFFVGPSGNAATLGSQNTAVGVYALSNNTSGSFNTAIGFNALYDNTETSDNTAIGNDALYSNNGSDNTAIGFNALYDNTETSDNTAIGNNALYSNNGSDNTAIGFDALYDNTSGYENTANGSEALFDNTTGTYNTAIGFQALFLNTSGSGNTAIGYSALEDNTTGSDNTAIGVNALFSTSGSYNIALGYGAGFYARFGSSNIDIGNQGSLATEFENNIIRIGSGQTTAYIAGVITGDGSGLSNLILNAAQLTSIGNTNTGSGNFFVGPSGNSTTSGSDNSGIGVGALYNNTSGGDNTAIGFYTLEAGSSSSQNTAIGFEALEHAGGVNNIGLGWGAGALLSGNESNNIEIGSFGMAGDNNVIRIGSGQASTYIAGVINGDGGGLTNLNVSAAQLTSIGNSNGFGNFFVGPSGNSTTSGVGNLADGIDALLNNTSGSYNTANGNGALEFNSGGSGNTAEGNGALANLGQNGTGGTNNIALGHLAGFNFTTNESGNIDIGNEGVSGENNIIRIGTSQTATYLVGTVYANDVALTSDRSAKENFTAVNPRAVLEKVTALSITQWKYKAEPAGIEHLGPMAQDFHAAFGLNGADEKHIATVDEQGVALAAIQGLNQKVNEKDAEIQSLKQQNDSLAQRLNELEAKVKQLAVRK